MQGEFCGTGNQIYLDSLRKVVLRYLVRSSFCWQNGKYDGSKTKYATEMKIQWDNKMDTGNLMCHGDTHFQKQWDISKINAWMAQGARQNKTLQYTL